MCADPFFAFVEPAAVRTPGPARRTQRVSQPPLSTKGANRMFTSIDWVILAVIVGLIAILGCALWLASRGR